MFLPRCMVCRRGLAMKILFVCPSVRPSLKRVNCDKTEEKSVHIFILYERSFSLVFWGKEWLVGATPYTWNFGLTGPVGATMLSSSLDGLRLSSERMDNADR